MAGALRMLPVAALVLLALMMREAHADPYASWAGTYEGGCTQYAYTVPTGMGGGYTFKCSPMPITNPFKVVIGRTRSGSTWQYTYSNQYYRAELTDLDGKTYLSDAGAVTPVPLTFGSGRKGSPICSKFVNSSGSWNIRQTFKKIDGVWTYTEYVKNYITPMKGGVLADCPTGKFTLGCDDSNGGYFYSYCTAWRVSS